MKVMETLIKLCFYFLFYFPSIVFPEYVLNLMLFWVRPIYRRLIKIEFWRNIIFKIGCLLTSKIILAVFWFVENISCWLLEYIILYILMLFTSNTLSPFHIFFILFAVGFDLIGLIGVGVHTQSPYANIPLFLDENKNFWLWSANPESFFQYHDGYFKKEKLLYRIYDQLGDKKKKSKFYDIL